MDNVRAILMVCVITYEAWTRRAACQVEGLHGPITPVDLRDECAGKGIPRIITFENDYGVRAAANDAGRDEEHTLTGRH